MGHKSVVIIDHDMLARAERDPEEFVRRLQMACLDRRHRVVGLEGATVANVVWSGHSRMTPVLRIDGFRAEEAQGEELAAYERLRIVRLHAEAKAKAEPMRWDIIDADGKYMFSTSEESLAAKYERKGCTRRNKEQS